MKKTLLAVGISLISLVSYSQDSASYKKKPTLSINFMMNDYGTAQQFKKSSLGGVLNNGTWSNLNQMSPGLNFSYYQGITPHVDFMSTLGGSFVNYTFEDRQNSGADEFLLEADANVNVKLLSDRYTVTPYFSAGVGVSKYSVYWGAYMPFGVGFQFKLSEESFLFTNFQYRVGITDAASNHLNYSIGFGAPLRGSGN